MFATIVLYTITVLRSTSSFLHLIMNYIHKACSCIYFLHFLQVCHLYIIYFWLVTTTLLRRKSQPWTFGIPASVLYRAVSRSSPSLPCPFSHVCDYPFEKGGPGTRLAPKRTWYNCCNLGTWRVWRLALRRRAIINNTLFVTWVLVYAHTSVVHGWFGAYAHEASQN